MGFLACRQLVRNLLEVPKLTEIRHDENDERMISQGTEDGMYQCSPLDFILISIQLSSSTRFTS